VNIRQVQKKDLETISKLLVKVFDESLSSNFTKQSAKEFKKNHLSEQSLYSRMSKLMFVAEDKGKIIGFIEANSNNLQLFFVDKEYQGKGIGKRLLNKIEKMVKNNKANSIHVDASIEAEIVYQSLGFKKTTGKRTKNGRLYQPMEKILLSFLVIILLNGCNITPPQEKIPTPSAETLTINKELDQPPKPQISKTTPSAETLTINKESGQYTIDIKYPKLIGYDDKINKIIKNSVDKEIKLFIDEATSLDLDADEIEKSDFGKSGLYVEYSNYLLNENYISILFESSVYESGAAHPYSYTWPFNYDVKNGKELELYDMFVPDSNFWDAISTTVIPKIEEKMGYENGLNNDWIKDGAGADPDNFQSFNITKKGFVFHFDPYQIAPYAAGRQDIEIDFEDLGAILMPEWT